MVLQNVDIFGITEKKKLDESFPISQFKIGNFVAYRSDRNSSGGGLMLFVNCAIPSRIRNDPSTRFADVENLVLERCIYTSGYVADGVRSLNWFPHYLICKNSFETGHFSPEIMIKITSGKNIIESFPGQ